MVLWIAMAALAAAACLSALVPLYRSGRMHASAAAPALAIYRDQLGEVDRDLARGVIADGEATAARTEIARRLVRAGSEAEPIDAEPERSRTPAAALVIAMPLAALGLFCLVLLVSHNVPFPLPRI